MESKHVHDAKDAASTALDGMRLLGRGGYAQYVKVFKRPWWGGII